MFCPYTALLDTLQGQEQNWSAQCLARVCRRDPLPGRAAPVRPLHLLEPGHPPCVVGIVSITAASHHVPGITGGSISHRLPLLLLSLLLQSLLASLIPQAPAAHSFRIKTQSSAGLLSLSAVGGKLHPVYLKKFASRGSKPAPCICTLRLSSWRGRLCAPVVGKGLPGWGTAHTLQAGQLLLTSKIPWEKGLPYWLLFVEYVGCTRHCAQNYSGTV